VQEIQQQWQKDHYFASSRTLDQSSQV